MQQTTPNPPAPLTRHLREESKAMHDSRSTSALDSTGAAGESFVKSSAFEWLSRAGVRRPRAHLRHHRSSRPQARARSRGQADEPAGCAAHGRASTVREAPAHGRGDRSRRLCSLAACSRRDRARCRGLRQQLRLCRGACKWDCLRDVRSPAGRTQPKRERPARHPGRLGLFKSASPPIANGDTPAGRGSSDGRCRTGTRLQRSGFVPGTLVVRVSPGNRGYGTKRSTLEPLQPGAPAQIGCAP
jgi:hypothetical protein